MSTSNLPKKVIFVYLFPDFKKAVSLIALSPLIFLNLPAPNAPADEEYNYHYQRNGERRNGLKGLEMESKKIIEWTKTGFKQINYNKEGNGIL